MKSFYANSLFHLQTLFRHEKQEKDSLPPTCPECNYVLDRPHAFKCSRCMASIPQATGCTGCGRCKNH